MNKNNFSKHNLVKQPPPKKKTKPKKKKNQLAIRTIMSKQNLPEINYSSNDFTQM